ncbi:MAG: glycosyltransferase family 39 protein [Planctomycetes bacterium]|nr:glycosyltransferase family 39 protein [Planctomycetota bacterium]
MSSARVLHAVPPSSTWSRRHAVLLALLIGAFVVAALPQCADLSRYHGDERFYTDAALSMRDSGDWLTPRYADGSGRFNKPFLAYWLIGASCELFGVSSLAARLPFLLAGAVILWATARAARVLFRDAHAALFAAVLLGSSPEFLQLVTRTTPDALLAAGVGVALAGAAELAFSERPARAAAWLFLGGAGIALLAKGGLGLLAPAFGLAWIGARRGRAGLASALRAGPLLLFAVLALGAFGPLLVAGGSVGLAKTIDDQVGTRFAESPAMVADNVATYLQCVVRHLLPWTALALGALLFARRRTAEWARGRGGEIAFVAAWYLVLLAIFSSGNIQRGRYFLPAYPLVAALVAALIAGTFATALGARVLRWTSFALAGTALLGAAALTWAAARLGSASPTAIAALAVALAGVAVLVRAARPSHARAVGAETVEGNTQGADEPSPLVAPVVACALLAIALPLGERSLRAGFDAAPSVELAARLEALGARGRAVQCFGGEAAFASQMRLLSAGRLDPTWSKALPASLAADARFVVLAPDIDEAALATLVAPRTIAAREACGFDYGKWRAADVRTVLAADDSAAELARRQRAYRIVTLAPPPKSD